MWELDGVRGRAVVQALGARAPDHSRNYQGERKYDFYRSHDRNSELGDDTKTPLAVQAITREIFSRSPWKNCQHEGIYLGP